jgi:hypothetical protein
MFKMKTYRLISILLSTLIFTSPLYPQPGTVKQLKLTMFMLQSTSLISQTGEELTSGSYRSDVWWFPVNVPSTVLTGLVANKIYPDPYTGLNNMFIPDASDEFNRKYDLEKYSHLPGQPNPWKKPYWYITDFKVPSVDSGRHFDLIFKGINYRAAVWLNGKQVADSTLMAGMFAEYCLDVSALIRTGEMNHLAVKIYPLDYPGLPAEEQLKAFDDFYANGGPTGDIGKNVTMLCSVGWDWIPPVRDRNMGIWQPVYLRTSGHVTIIQPRVITSLPSLPDTGRAAISVKFKLRNIGVSDDKGKVIITIAPETFKGEPVGFAKDITVIKNRTTVVSLSPENTRELVISDPHLWWPNGYGKADLYRITLRYYGASGLSDEQSFLFGIRSVSSEAVDINGTWRRDFYVNGRRIQLTGGAWVPDMMLNRDSIRYDNEFRLCRNSNINLVRIWGGGVTPSDHFFDAADRYGLLVWSDFWITGDTQGEFKGSPEWPVEGEVFKRNVASTIYRIRNHPSLLVWTGGNEGHARKELYYAMRDSIIMLDGTRPFIPSSSGFAKLPEGWEGSWPDGKPAGVYSGGPYAWQDPKVYYQKADAGLDWVFKDETGIPSQPPYSSLPKNIVNLVWDKSLPFPLNNSWGYHDACTGNGHYENYYKEMVKRYGEPASMKEFSDKMQLMNASGYQGIFEAAGHKLNEIGGVMLWKLNAAFPSVVWQVYDWFLVPNAGYYFMQNACEPVHIQLNTKDLNVEYINRTYEPLKSLIVRIEIYNLESKLMFYKRDKIDMGASESREGFQLDGIIKKIDGVSFVILNLETSSGKLLSHNVYWLSGNNDFRSLTALKQADIKADVLEFKKGENENYWTFRFTNTGKVIAFFINPQILSGDEEILPSFWSTNYFTLAPGETIIVKGGFPPSSLKGRPVLKLEGWNAGERYITLGNE